MPFVPIVSLSRAMPRRKHQACIDNQTNSYVLQALSVRPTGQYTLVVTYFIETLYHCGYVWTSAGERVWTTFDC